MTNVNTLCQITCDLNVETNRIDTHDDYDDDDANKTITSQNGSGMEETPSISEWGSRFIAAFRQIAQSEHQIIVKLEIFRYVIESSHWLFQLDGTETGRGKRTRGGQFKKFTRY